MIQDHFMTNMIKSNPFHMPQMQSLERLNAVRSFRATLTSSRQTCFPGVQEKHTNSSATMNEIFIFLFQKVMVSISLQTNLVTIQLR